MPQSFRNPQSAIRKFRARHPLKSARLGGVRWEYIACGCGEQTLLLLPGAPGRGETAFQHILAFESDYRVISPGYPAPLAALSDMLDGLAGILEVEGVARVHLVGGSYSGLIAQSFVRRYPQKVARLVLSDTGVPSRKRARKYSGYLKILEALPLPAIHALWRLGAYLYLREIDSDRAFWRAYFRELISTITKQECVGRLKVWIDFDHNSRFSPADLRGWSGRILILEADHDTTFPPQERAALRRLYPQALVRTFRDSGHAASISRRSEYIRAITAFIDPQAPCSEAAS